MTGMKAFGTLLTANADDRTLTYRLLPFGEQGNTSLGKVTATKGTLAIPDLPNIRAVNDAHDRERPLAKFVSVAESDEGIDATVRVLSTRAGDDFLIEATEGVKTGISVEIDNPVIRAGNLLGGELTGAGFTTTPAFPSAQLVAADAGDLQDENEDISTTETVTETEKEEPEVVPENQAVTATANQNLTASALGLSTGSDAVNTLDDAARLMATGYATGNLDTRRLTAATGDITTGNAENTQPPGWLGEVWSQRTYRSRFVNLFKSSPLTALKAVGWRFTDLPGVDAYTAFGTPHTSDVDTEAVEVIAKRFAGANKVDRANFDFSNPAFWAGYYREQGNSVARQVDADALGHMLTAANYTAAAATTTALTGAQKTLSAVVDGIIAVQDRSVPDFALIPLSLWRDILLLKESDKFAYLSVALGLDPEDARVNQFQFVPTTDTAIETATGGKKVLVGATEAHTHYGEKTVRAETVNIGDGSVSVGLYGYNAFLTGDPQSFSLITLAA